MDKIAKYQQIIKDVLLQFKDDNYNPPFEEYENQIVMDDERGHYFVFGVGWNKYKRIHGCTIHIDLKGEKIWVQQDWTDSIIVDKLMELGAAKEDIVLAFRALYKRPYTGFAVN